MEFKDELKFLIPFDLPINLETHTKKIKFAKFLFFELKRIKLGGKIREFSELIIFPSKSENIDNEVFDQINRIINLDKWIIFFPENLGEFITNRFKKNISNTFHEIKINEIMTNLIKRDLFGILDLERNELEQLKINHIYNIDNKLKYRRISKKMKEDITSIIENEVHKNVLIRNYFYNCILFTQEKEIAGIYGDILGEPEDYLESLSFLVGLITQNAVLKNDVLDYFVSESNYQRLIIYSFEIEGNNYFISTTFDKTINALICISFIKNLKDIIISKLK